MVPVVTHAGARLMLVGDLILDEHEAHRFEPSANLLRSADLHPGDPSHLQAPAWAGFRIGRVEATPDREQQFDEISWTPKETSDVVDKAKTGTETRTSSAKLSQSSQAVSRAMKCRPCRIAA